MQAVLVYKYGNLVVLGLILIISIIGLLIEVVSLNVIAVILDTINLFSAILGIVGILMNWYWAVISSGFLLTFLILLQFIFASIVLAGSITLFLDDYHTILLVVGILSVATLLLDLVRLVLSPLSIIFSILYVHYVVTDDPPDLEKGKDSYSVTNYGGLDKSIGGVNDTQPSETVLDPVLNSTPRNPGKAAPNLRLTQSSSHHTGKYVPLNLTTSQSQ